MPKGITVNQEFYSYQHLKETSQYTQENEYFYKVLKFCNSWLNGLEQMDLHTSGSTGIPKTVQFKRSQLLASVQGTAKALNLDRNDRALICINTSYIGGRMMLIRSMELEMDACVVKPSSNPFQGINTPGFTFFAFAPIQLQTIFQQNSQHLLEHGKAIIIGGGALNNESKDLIRTIDTPAYHTFGMTETASHIALKRLNGIESDQPFVALENVELKTDDRDCLQIRGPQTDDQWIRTNDIVSLHNSREFEWVGRIDDIINTGGIKVLIPDLEEKIRPLMENFIGSKRFAISKIPEPMLMEQIILVVEHVVSHEEKNRLLEILRKHLPKYHAPRELFTLPEIPLTETGKIKRKLLEQMISDLSA